MWPLSLKRMTIVATAITGVLTALILIVSTTRSAEPFWLATRGHVAEQLHTTRLKIAADVSKVEVRQISTQLQMAKTSRRDIQSKIEDKQLLLQQNPVLPQGVRDTINDQVRSLKEEYEDISSTIGNLQREQQGRP